MRKTKRRACQKLGSTTRYRSISQPRPGTRCVIREHATVGLVVTTDGSIADLPREAYLEAERRILAELDAIGKPYIILLNCADPDSEIPAVLPLS